MDDVCMFNTPQEAGHVLKDSSIQFGSTLLTVVQYIASEIAEASTKVFDHIRATLDSHR